MHATLTLRALATLFVTGVAFLPACAMSSDEGDADEGDVAESADAYSVGNASAYCSPAKAYVSPAGHSFYFECRRSFYQEPNQDGSKWRAVARCCTEAGCRKVYGNVQPYADQVTLKSVGSCSGYVSNVRMQYFPHSCSFGGCGPDAWRTL